MKRSSCRVTVSFTRPPNSPASQPPHAHTTTSPSIRAPSSTATVRGTVPLTSDRELRGTSPLGRGRGRSSPRARRLGRRAPAPRAGRAARPPPARAGRTRGRRRGSSGTGARASATSSRSHGIPCSRMARSDAASQPCSECANQDTPHSTISSWPLSASSSRHSVRERRAIAVYSASAPCEQRISRVSPPDVARRSPGSNWSTSVTRSPARASNHASEAPNVPAPTITTFIAGSGSRRTAPCPSRSAAGSRARSKETRSRRTDTGS